MLAIDTNIVIRFLTRDHQAQARRALEIVSNNDVFVPVTVVLEAEWVLRDAYALPRDDVIRELRRFCGLERVTVGAADVMERALNYRRRIGSRRRIASRSGNRLRSVRHFGQGSGRKGEEIASKLGFGLPDAPRARSQWSAEPSGA